MKLEDLQGDGSIPCFKAEGNHWSFVKTDNLGNVIEVQEKIEFLTIARLELTIFRQESFI